MIIDGKDLILGRLGTFIAKKALLGENIDIVNCEQIVMTGKKDFILKKYIDWKDRGIPAKGPFTYRRPDMFVKRALRGMFDYKKSRGKEGFARVKCYIGVPNEFKDKKTQEIEGASIQKLPNVKYLHLGEISKLIGAKQ